MAALGEYSSKEELVDALISLVGAFLTSTGPTGDFEPSLLDAGQ